MDFENKLSYRTLLASGETFKERNLFSLNSKSIGLSFGGLYSPLIVELRYGMSAQSSSNKANFFLYLSLLWAALLWLNAVKYDKSLAAKEVAEIMSSYSI